MQAIEPYLYNSRITQTYIDYLRTTYPDLKIEKILQKAGMTKDELADDAHWFTQSQVDRFHEVLVAITGDKNIARHAGRFVASAQGLNLLKQYVIGLMNIETVFCLDDKNNSIVYKRRNRHCSKAWSRQDSYYFQTQSRC